MNSNDVTSVAREAMAMRRAMAGVPKAVPLDAGLKVVVFFFTWIFLMGVGVLIGGGIGGSVGAPVGLVVGVMVGLPFALWLSAVVSTPFACSTSTCRKT